jgi:hypothetical protein
LGHTTPPFRAGVLVRVRVWWPIPHEVVHVVYALHCPTMQSTGHSCALQARFSAECGHAAPPNLGATFVRLRFCEPTPHDLVHVDQAPNEPTAQSVAHAASLQVRVSARYGHT